MADFQLNVAISTIHNYLEGRLLTLKKVHYIAADANNARNKALHVEYVQAISAHMQDNKTIIWMDETNVNLYCRRTQGRAPPGQRAAVALLGSKGPNVHGYWRHHKFPGRQKGASFEMHFGRKARRTGLLICYSISHRVIIQLTCALMQRCTPIFIL